MGTKKSKIWPKKSGKIHKNREKNLQFFGVKQSKIRWTDLEIKFIKSKTLAKVWEPKNQKFGLKNLERYIKNREKNLQFFGVKQSKIRWTDLKIKLMKHKKIFSLFLSIFSDFLVPKFSLKFYL